MAQPSEYDSTQKRMIHQLMAALFSGDELNQFTASNFRPVFDRFTPQMDSDTRIRMLIEYCAYHNQLGGLVARIQRTKPAAYQTFVQRIQGAPKQPPPPEPAPITPAQPAPSLVPVPPSAEQEIPQLQQTLQQTLTNRYRIGEVLDTSGRGAVFKAFDTQIELDVAIKVIALNRVRQPALRERVRQEARTAMRLDHPGVVQVYDFGETDSLFYIIMEFISGASLTQVRQPFRVIDKRTTLPQILELVRQLSLTVDFMHQQGVLHPSMAPDNVMLKPNGTSEVIAWQPVLINFALLRPNRETFTLREAISMDQLAYQVSPELLLGHVTDVRSDVYALGVLLYDLVVGQPPFRPRDLTEAVRLHVEVTPPPPRSTIPELPEAVEQVILKALAKDPAERYLTAKGMAQALADCLEGVAPSAQAVVPPPAPTPADLAEVTIAMETPHQPFIVTPGASLSTQLILRNEGGQEDHCQVRIQGIPPNWISISPAVTILSPGEVQEVELTIQPPLSPLSRAGRYALTIQVVSQQDPERSNEMQQVLTIADYVQFSTTLWPEDISPEQIVQVSIENQGNTVDTFTIRPELTEGLVFEPDQFQVHVAPGEIATTDFHVAPARKRWIGKKVSQTFSFQISSSQGMTQTQSGQLISQGVIAPEWVLAGVLAVALFCCAFFAVYPVLIAPPTPTPTPQPTPTSISTVASTLVPTVETLTPVPTVAPPPTFTPIPAITLTPTSIPTVAPVTSIPVITPTPTPSPTPETSQPPRAVIVGPNNVQVNQSVTFDGRSSEPGSSNIVIYTWDFGDGNRGNGAVVNHIYNTAGNYLVTLTVTDENNQNDTTSLGIQVTQ